MKVTRNSKTGKPLTLATIGIGDAFGEEALLSDAKRNANVIMETSGSLMRLSKDDFNEEVEEVEEFTQVTDSIPEKKVSVSIEQLRKKMSDDKEN